MLDLGFVRDHLDLVAEKMALRGGQFDLEAFRTLDRERRAAISQAESLKGRKNKASEQVASLKRSGQDASAIIAEMKQVGDEIALLDGRAKELDEQMREFMKLMPNLPHSSVPVGKSADDNVEVRKWGTPREFSFTPKPHWEIGEALGILDLERAAKLSGARFVLYMGLGAKLERALQNFMLDMHTSRHGYTEVLPPAMVNAASLFGTANLPKFADELFHIEGRDLHLIPTAEVPVTNIYRDEVIDGEKLPLKYCAHTPCFRSEAGSYGKDVRGITRVHQFQKVELVKFAHPSTSYDELDALTHDAEAILEALELPYRTVALCTGDLGANSAKTYDIEVWLPGQSAYREISSCSNFEDFQARRANIRFKNAKGKNELVHTLNGSGVALGRTWLAILENYQQEDGSVVVPTALRTYMGVDRITRR